MVSFPQTGSVAAVAARKLLIVPVAATAEITDGVERDYPRYRYGGADLKGGKR